MTYNLQALVNFSVATYLVYRAYNNDWLGSVRTDELVIIYLLFVYVAMETTDIGCKTSHTGSEYEGGQSISKEGNPCYSWAGSSVVDMLSYSGMSIDNNECRNPYNYEVAPFCRTSDPDDPDEIYQFCQVPYCANVKLETESGVPCVFPFTAGGLQHSSCIKDNDTKYWCSTTSNFDLDGQHAYCNAPIILTTIPTTSTTTIVDTTITTVDTTIADTTTVDTTISDATTIIDTTTFDTTIAATTTDDTTIAATTTDDTTIAATTTDDTTIAATTTDDTTIAATTTDDTTIAATTTDDTTIAATITVHTITDASTIEHTTSTTKADVVGTTSAVVNTTTTTDANSVTKLTSLKESDTESFHTSSSTVQTSTVENNSINQEISTNNTVTIVYNGSAVNITINSTDNVTTTSGHVYDANKYTSTTTAVPIIPILNLTHHQVAVGILLPIFVTVYGSCYVIYGCDKLHKCLKVTGPYRRMRRYIRHKYRHRRNIKTNSRVKLFEQPPVRLSHSNSQRASAPTDISCIITEL
ncbi:unnamed protein product [Owenia fusiformis]|uniref:Uncharacterized protein n=1 Tax=Owenia fusiformis TaxID=6347 RepID=A0A8S4N3X3_OWEFU|nr:unnamed protein product [Owenia fusiformis]